VQQLGVQTVVLPAAAGVASAIGLLAAEVKFDLSRSRLLDFGQLDSEEAEDQYREMEREAEQVLGARPAALVRELDLRYSGQGYELTVPYENARQEFERLYARRYGLASPGESLEVTTWRLTAIAEMRRVDLPRFEPRETPLPQRRLAYFPECGGFTETPVHARHQLSPGWELEGPAVIEERGSTTVLPPGARARVDQYGSLLARW
jgi:N-methylhydantoinase A